MDDIKAYKKRKWAELQEGATLTMGTASSGFGVSELARLMDIVARQHADYKALSEYRDVLGAQVKALATARDEWFIPELDRLNKVVAQQAADYAALKKQRQRRSPWGSSAG